MSLECGGASYHRSISSRTSTYARRLTLLGILELLDEEEVPLVLERKLRDDLNNNVHQLEVATRCTAGH